VKRAVPGLREAAVSQQTASTLIDLHHRSQSESWLVVYADGRINYHVENNEHAFWRHGGQARDEWIEFEFVRSHWPHLAGAVEAALLALNVQEDESDQHGNPTDDDEPSENEIPF
jgi:hypothetical protein